jgi:hypothetical protein
MRFARLRYSIKHLHAAQSKLNLDQVFFNPS